MENDAFPNFDVTSAPGSLLLAKARAAVRSVLAVSMTGFSLSGEYVNRDRAVRTFLFRVFLSFLRESASALFAGAKAQVIHRLFHNMA
jgi:hypothetical protein